MALLKRMTSNIAAQTLALFASTFDRIALVGLQLRLWGADGFADWSVLQAAATLLSFAELGMQLYFLNKQKMAFDRADMSEFSRWAALALTVYASLSALVALLFVAFCLLTNIRDFFDLKTLDEHASLWVFLTLGLMIIVNMGRASLTTIYTAAGEYARGAMVSALVQFATTAAACLTLLLGAQQPVLALVMFLVGGVGAFCFTFFDVRSRYPASRVAPRRVHGAEIGDIFRHSRWFALQQGGPVLWVQLPVIVLNRFQIGGHQLAAFLLMRTAANLGRQALTIASISAGVEIASVAHREVDAHDGKSRAWALTLDVGIMISALSGAIGCAFLAFGPSLMFHWGHDATLFDPLVAALLVAPILLTAALQQPMSLLQYTNRAAAVGAPRLVQLIAGMILCVLGAKLGGLVGVVAGLCLAETAALWLTLVFERARMFASDMRVYYWRATIAAAAAGLWSFAVGWAIISLVSPWTLLGFLGGGALWVVFGVTPIAATATPAPMRQRLMSGITSLIARRRR